MIKKPIFLIAVGVSSLFGFEKVDIVGPLGVHYGNLTSINEKYLPENITNYQVNYAEKGNYQVFINVLGNANLETVKEKKELFFGLQEDYYEKMENDIKALNVASQSGMGAMQALHSMPNSLMSSGADALKGAGVGLVMGPLVAYIDGVIAKRARGPEYYHVFLITDTKGNQAKVTSLFICDSKNYTEDEIKNLINLKEKEKGIK